MPKLQVEYLVTLKVTITHDANGMGDFRRTDDEILEIIAETFFDPGHSLIHAVNRAIYENWFDGQSKITDWKLTNEKVVE